MTFGTFGHTKVREKKSIYKIKDKTQVQPTPKKNIRPSRFFFCICRRKRKSYKKENAAKEISCSVEHDKGDLPLTQPPFEKGGRKL